MNREAGPKAGHSAAERNGTALHYRSLVFADRDAALALTAEGIAATTVDDILVASGDEIIGSLDGTPAVFVRDPMPGFNLDEQAAMEKVLDASGRVRIVRP